MPSERLNIASSEDGSSLVELAFFLPFLLGILMGVADFGRAYFLAIEVAGAAHAGAVYGAQNITDITGMQNAAKLNAPDVSGLTATGSWGCECSDGTASSASCTIAPTCSVNVVYYAKVTTSVLYNPIIVPFKGINSPISPMTLTGSTTMRSASE
jgi:Flp pilus assembly protein TadG